MGSVVGEDNNVHVTGFGDHAQHTDICSIFASLYNILLKYVEQDKLSTSIYAFGDHAQNTGMSQRFCLFVQHTVQVVAFLL